MLNLEQIEKFKNDYFLMFGQSLEGENPSEVNGFINEVDMDIEAFITNNCPLYKRWKAQKRLNPFQIEAIRDAKLIQANYVLHVGDFNKNAGYNPITMQYTEDKVLQQKAISKRAIQVLKQHGLLYAGVNEAPAKEDLLPYI